MKLNLKNKNSLAHYVSAYGEELRKGGRENLKAKKKKNPARVEIGRWRYKSPMML